VVLFSIDASGTRRHKEFQEVKYYKVQNGEINFAKVAKSKKILLRELKEVEQFLEKSMEYGYTPILVDRIKASQHTESLKRFHSLLMAKSAATREVVTDPSLKQKEAITSDFSFLSSGGGSKLEMTKQLSSSSSSSGVGPARAPEMTLGQMELIKPAKDRQLTSEEGNLAALGLCAISLNEIRAELEGHKKSIDTISTQMLAQTKRIPIMVESIIAVETKVDKMSQKLDVMMTLMIELSKKVDALAVKGDQYKGGLIATDLLEAGDSSDEEETNKV